MKFLIFNIIVFCSLGYLLTSKSNENFIQWTVNTKNKISQISKDEVVSTLKKATAKNNEEKEIINSEKKEKLTENSDLNKNNYKEDFNKKESSNLESKKNNLRIRNIIDEILAEKKFNEFNNKIKIKDTNEISKPKETVIVKNIEPKKINIINEFMTHQERENSLAELITDMELYHLNSFKN
tara:strand:+ start:1772 stop:2317 length:546 start_codon:yes stop_codon:yes gene_type:complete